MNAAQAIQAYTQQQSQDDEECDRKIKKMASPFNLEEDPGELATNEMKPDEDFGVSNSFSGESLYSFYAKTGQTKMKPNLNGVEAQAILDLVSSQEGAIVNNGANLLITSNGKKLFETDENGVVTFSIAQHDQNFSRRQSPLSNSMELLKTAMQSRIQVESHTKDDIEIGQANGNKNSEGVKKLQTPPSTIKQSTQAAEVAEQQAETEVETEVETETETETEVETEPETEPEAEVEQQAAPVPVTPVQVAPAQSSPMIPLLGTDERKISTTRAALNILGKYYRSPEYKQSNPGVVISNKTNILDDYKSAHIDLVRESLGNPNLSVQKITNMKTSPEAKITMTNDDIENLQKAQEWQRAAAEEQKKANSLNPEGNPGMGI
jgi:hypothetical protein